MEWEIYPSSFGSSFGSSIAVAECRHVSLYIAPGGKIFVYFYSVRKSDRPFVRPPSDLETKIRRALALSSGVILIEHAAADLLVVVVFVLYYRLFTSRGKKPAAIYEPDRTLDVRRAKRDKYAFRSAREAGGYHKYPLYLWISPDAVHREGGRS